MNNNVTLEPLDVNNWLKICDLSVSDEQKEFFSMPKIDRRYQGKGYGEADMLLMMEYMREEMKLPAVNISYRKENITAGNLYESLGFEVFGGDDAHIWRTLAWR